MIYKIGDKYYTRSLPYYYEVELVFSDNDVDLKPTDNIIYDYDVHEYEVIKFLDNKERLIAEHKNKQKDIKNKENDKEEIFSSYRSR